LKSLEIRIGLVLYGGVSLAIYMNGVCNEFFRAVKGEGIYGLIKEIRNCEIVIDVISGSSAGGINGIFLTYCLANKHDFSICKNFWVKNGGLTNLLNLKKRNNYKSLFDSEGYYEQTYIDLFNELENCKICELQDLKELDLFITGTNFHGNEKDKDTMYYDSIFLIKYRKKRKELFKDNKKCIPALARLARITSAFPGAFSPVGIKSDQNEMEKNINENLRYWGNLNENKEYYFIDGGAVRNKPFSCIIKGVFSRNADREIERKLFYLDPAPNNKEKETIDEPGFINNIKTALFQISSFQSIKEDFVKMEERNRRLKNYYEIRNSLLIDFFRKKNSKLLSKFIEHYYLMRQNYLISELCKKNDNFNFENLKTLLENYFKLNNRNDLHFLFRRISFLIYNIYDVNYNKNSAIREYLKRNLEKIKTKELREIWKLYNILTEIYEILISKFERAVSVQIQNADFLYLKKKFNDKIFNIKKISYNELYDFKERVAKIKFESFDLYNNLTKFILKIEKKILCQYNIKFLKKLYDNFDKFDMILFPIQMNSDIMEKDILEPIKISPESEDHICGELLFHFGAFLKESWRAHDIMKGRLDGCLKITHELLNDKLIASDNINKSLINIELIRKYFKNLSLEEENKIEKILSAEEYPQKYICLKNFLIEIEQNRIFSEERKNIKL